MSSSAPRYVRSTEFTSSDDDTEHYSHVMDLLLAIGQGPEWHERAACRGLHNDAANGPNIFFPNGHGSPTKPAKDICETCDAQKECLDSALSNREYFGIWGNRSERQRKIIRSEQGITKRPKPGTGSDSPHGTCSRYRYGCRCISCVDAWNAYQRKLQGQRRRRLQQDRKAS